MESGILDVCGDGLKRLEAIGCAVEPAVLGTPPEQVWQAWLVWRRALVASRLTPFLLDPKNRAHVKPEALWEYEQAQNLSGTQFMAASVQRTAFYHHMRTLLERYDFVALPTAQVWPFAAQQRWPQQISEHPMDSYHRWMEVTIYATFAGLPCISVPVGFNAQGLPMGMQIIGRPQADLEVLQIGYAYEQVAQQVLRIRPPEPLER